jgi:copper chaperone
MVIKLMTWKLTIPNMACSACVTNITSAVQAVDAQATLSADLSNKLVSIDSKLSLAEISQAITQAGYPVQT